MATYKGLHQHTVQEATNLVAQRRVIRVTPTVVAGTTDNNDVAIATTAIPNAVLNSGGCSKLVGLTMIDYDQEAHDMDIVFMQTEQSLGTINSAVTIDDATVVLAKLLGILSIDWSESTIPFAALQTIHVAQHEHSTAKVLQLPMLLQAEEGSTDVYFSIIAREAIAWAAVGNLELIFHIEY